jgi:hypothetical protein
MGHWWRPLLLLLLLRHTATAQACSNVTPCF